ncbi:ATP-binding protein [Streptomyces sp. NPDC006012]|uniref:ATP-binding protein n=1 Tax=Streptomyces sp. NPDC006012 TaxID=3364739 RepID=UPI0036822C3A
MKAHRFALSVPTTPIAVTAARRQAVDAIEGWDAGLGTGVVHTAELVISEFVTNAVQHAGGDLVSLTVRLDEATLRIEVGDACPVLPRPALPDLYSESGRGLFLVAVLTHRYGVEPTADGKRCWAEIALPSSPNPEIDFSLPLQRSC